MSRALHLVSRNLPGYGPSDSGKYLPCSGVSGKAVAVSTCPSNSVHGIPSRAKIVSLTCTTVGSSITCRASSGGHRRNPDFSRQNRYSRSRNRKTEEREGSEILEESMLLSSKNGPVLSISNSPKFLATATPGPREKEIVELFRKVQAQLRERAAIKEEKKIEASQGQNKDTETVDSLLKLLRKHSVEHGKRSSSGGSSKDFMLDQPEQNGLLHEVKSTSSFGSNSIFKDDSQVSNASSARPVSKFRRKSPIPSMKYTPVYSEKDTANSISHMEFGENKRVSTVDTYLQPEPEPEPEPESVPESKPENLPEPDHGFEPQVIFSEEDVFGEMSEIDASDTDEAYNDHGQEQELHEHMDLTVLKLPELRTLAKSRGVKGFSKMKKQELVELLSGVSI